MKTCSRCKELKEESEFSKRASSKDGLRGDCKTCCREYDRANAERRRTYIQEWRKKNPQRRQGTHFKHRYGISLSDYEALLERQQGCCAICGTKSSTLNEALCVDHCHQSGKVRGLLCRACNTGIGHLKECPTILNSAISYLKAA